MKELCIHFVSNLFKYKNIRKSTRPTVSIILLNIRTYTMVCSIFYRITLFDDGRYNDSVLFGKDTEFLS